MPRWYHVESAIVKAGLARPSLFRKRHRRVFRKIVTAIIVVPLVVMIVAFAVANRQAVTVSFDPLSSAHPAYAATLPLFVVIFVVLILGVLIGGVAAWIGRANGGARREGSTPTCARCAGSMDAIRRRFGTAAAAPARAGSRAFLAIPPPLA